MKYKVPPYCTKHEKYFSDMSISQILPFWECLDCTLEDEEKYNELPQKLEQEHDNANRNS